MIPQWLQKGYHQIPYAVYIFQYFVAFVRVFPDAFSECIFSLTRILFLFLLGFATFIRRFGDGEFAIFMLAIVGTIAYAQKHKQNEREAKEEEEKIREHNENLEAELNAQKGICSTLEYVKAALESKKHSEQLVENENASLRDKVEQLQDQCQNYGSDIEELHCKIANLTSDLAIKNKETISLKEQFKNKLDKFENAITEVKKLEKERNEIRDKLIEEQSKLAEKEECIKSFKSTVETLTNQRTQLLEKYGLAIKQLGVIKNENRALSRSLQCQSQAYKQDTERIDEIEELTQKLQTSLSNAKGRLSKVGGVLGDKKASRIQTPSKSTMSFK